MYQIKKESKVCIRPIITTTNFNNYRPVFKAGPKVNSLNNKSKLPEETVSDQNPSTTTNPDVSVKSTSKDNYGYNKEIVEEIGPDGKTYYYLVDREYEPYARIDSVSPRDPLGIYFKEIDKYPLLTDEEELEVAKRMIENNDEEARLKLIRSNLRFVVSVAKRYMDRGIPILDLINDGNLGLIRATKSYDYTRGFKFCTYANNWVEAYIRQAIGDTVRTVRVPASMQNKISKIKKATAELERELSRHPTIQEIADKIGLPEAKIKAAIRADRKQVSLDKPLHPEDSRNVIDTIASIDFPVFTKEEDVIDEMRLKKVMTVFKQLSETDQEILKLKFGLKSRVGKTWSQVADICNITENQAKLALRRLKKLCKSAV